MLWEAFVSVVSLLVQGGGVVVGCLFRSSSLSAKHSLASSTSSSLVRCACYDCSCRELKSVELSTYKHHTQTMRNVLAWISCSPVDSWLLRRLHNRWSVFTFTFHLKRWLFLISHSLLLFAQLASGLMKICFNGGQAEDREQQKNFSCKFTSLLPSPAKLCMGILANVFFMNFRYEQRCPAVRCWARRKRMNKKVCRKTTFFIVFLDWMCCCCCWCYFSEDEGKKRRREKEATKVSSDKLHSSNSRREEKKDCENPANSTSAW